MALRVTDHTSAPVAGYLDSVSYQPGARVHVHASGRQGPVTIDLVRLGHDGSEATVEVVEEVSPKEARVEPQPLPLGSRASAAVGALDSPCSVGTWFKIARFPETCATIVSLVGSADSLHLTVDSQGQTCLVDGAGRSAVVGWITEHQWYLAAIVVSGGARAMCTTAGTLQQAPCTLTSHELLVSELGIVSVEFAGLMNADGRNQFLDGLIDSPFVLSREVSVGDLEYWNSSVTTHREIRTDQSLMHYWDTTRDFHQFTVSDDQNGVDLALIGGPTRSLPGRWWIGDVHDPRLAPEQFGAIHFHSDDLIDAMWPIIATIELPVECPVGVYGVRLTPVSGDWQDIVPLIVRSTSPHGLTVLLPTLTYLAYANEHARPPGLAEYFPDLAAVFARENDLHSWYDRHRDGTPVVLCSLRRPLFGFRHDHRFRYTGSDHGISADLRLIGWLERQGLEFSLMCDHDLDKEGSAALGDVHCLVTGAHPEYWTAPMLDALDTHIKSGGHLAYLGGNGMVWSVHIDHELSIAEMRRGDVEERPYEGDVGTANFQLSGHRSGLWQTLGRPAASFTGLTAGCMGFSIGSSYRFTDAASSKSVASLVEGIDLQETFGGSGQVLGAAAAYETDFFNTYLGSPPECTVIATARLPQTYLPFAPGFHASPSGEDERTRVRSDIVLWNTPYGGIVWSVGSIAWTGALNDDPVVAQMTRNALMMMREAS